VAFDAADPLRLGRWWSVALGWPVAVEDDEGVELAVPSALDSPGEVPSLSFNPVRDSKTVKNRVHLDLASESQEGQEATVERLVSLGARPIDIGQHGVPWVVLADPEGNEFCVLEPRERFVATGVLACIVLDALDPGALARFWVEASGWAVAEEFPEGVSLRRPSGLPPDLDLVRVTEPHAVKNRVHFDVAPLTGYVRDDEARRLLRLGARSVDVGQGPDVPWVVLADPEGNELCVLGGS
jgi:hypothetical protein